MKILIPVILFFLLIASGCDSTETVESTNVAASEVYQSYFIKSNKSQTSVSATFRVGSKSGATIDLDAPSKIEYNGKLMPEIAPTSWKGTTYEDALNKFTSNHKFLYTDAAGKAFLNEFNLEPVEIGGNSFVVSRAKRMLLPLSRAVGNGEEISAELSGTAKPVKSQSNDLPGSDSVTLQLVPARNALIVEPDELKNLINGRARVSLTIKKVQPLKQTGAKGGEIELTYEAQGAAINLTK